MPSITFISHDGVEKEVHVAPGTSVMQAAIDNAVSGILADCGGACSCATCHCYVDEAWKEKVPAAEDIEAQMLDFVMDPEENSRLSCQIVVSEELDGLIVRLPASQI
ncbi:2Fe-2S iron-sulfur cluster binding domain-containing protein [Parahaliea maris]|uniref:2Fe-2S iron-sulfur cluster binding domain-containing protein n=1 Tax=Parahaliea maris TaxID=2716870 RepID=A0A5C9A8H7_9GAMM|nr:2Fe-2S iron-sulfur cluster-binding protein [Parahaliea maris]TXS95867.1 2Fe-2S iron-sulfur cluster binding domain-containing protein [Parahaliea maris]